MRVLEDVMNPTKPGILTVEREKELAREEMALFDKLRKSNLGS